MVKFFKSQYFEDKSVSKYSVFLLSNRFLKEFTKKVLIVKQLSLLSIKMPSRAKNAEIVFCLAAVFSKRSRRKGQGDT